MNRFFTLLLAASCLTAVGQVESICGCQTENSSSINLELAAPDGFKLGEVLFASYGTPTGDCENGFATSDCHADNSVSVIESYLSDCTSSLSVSPNNELFGDPCDGIVKKLCVEIAIEPFVMGCLNADACNYNPEANLEDGSCHFDCQFCLTGTVWSEELGGCIGDGSGDINLDGCVQLNDLLDLLSAYSNCSAEESTWQCGDPLEYQGYDYETVQIGDQCWFAENLRAENFENGEAIPTEFTEYQWAAWQSLQLPGSFVYGENQGECASWVPDFQACDTAVALSNYGRLYNGFAVDDERGLCPSGWHVPEDFEFGILVNTVGGVDVAGLALKSSTGWGQNGNCCIGLDGNGTNEYGFNGLPGGTISGQGYSGNAGLAGSWWTSTPASYNAAYTSKHRIATAQEQSLPSNDSYMGAGMSIRCIKD